MTGVTDSPDFPTANALQPAYGGGSNDAFVLCVSTPPQPGGAWANSSAEGKLIQQFSLGERRGLGLASAGRYWFSRRVV